MQRVKEYNTALPLCFVDICKAYDSVNRNALWEVLRRSYNLPSKIINIIKALHDGTQKLVRYKSQTSEEFTINLEVKQGNVLAPLLFNLFLNAVTNSALKTHKQIGRKILYNIKAPLVNSELKIDSHTIV